LKYQPRRPPHVEQLILRGHPFQVTHWPGQGEFPWIWLHGFADVGQTFQFVIDASESNHACSALDLRGFGGSVWQQSPYWFADYLADIDAWLDLAYPATAVNLIGHSMGGNLAMMYAGVRPERVQRLVNIEGVGLADAAASEAPARYRRWLDELKSGAQFARFNSVDQLQAVLMRKNPRLDEAVAHYVAGLWARQDDDQFTINADPFHKLVNPVLYRRAEVLACWREIKAPTLVVLGSESAIAKRFALESLVAEFKENVSSVTVEIIPNVGHMIQHEAATTLARLIDDFLTDS